LVKAGNQKPERPSAEIHALQQAGSKAKEQTAYVTLELAAILAVTPHAHLALIEAGGQKVVAAMVEFLNPLVAGSG